MATKKKVRLKKHPAKTQKRLTDTIDEMALEGDKGEEKEVVEDENTDTTDKEDFAMKGRMGIGVDVGTGFLVSARFTGKEDEDISFVSIRDAFYKLEKHLFNEQMFNKNKMKYIENDDEIFVVGEDALTFARIQNSSASRPLAKGIINPQEKSSAPVLREMFRYIIQGYIGKEGEKLVYSIPGTQVTNPEFDTVYHSMSLSSLLRQFGCDPVPQNEAFLVIVSELGAQDEITGLGFSFGAGLVNCCFTYKGVNLFEFSINKSGDFIDKQAADAVGESTASISYIKENKLDLNADEYSVSPEERALIFSHRFVVQHTLQEVKKAFQQSQNVKIFEDIPIIISGGTSKPPGFIDLFKTELKTARLPFGVSKVTHAKDPLTSVARGACIWANSLES